MDEHSNRRSPDRARPEPHEGPERGYGEWTYHGPSTWRSPERWRGHRIPGTERRDWAAPRGSETRDPLTGAHYRGGSPEREGRRWSLPANVRRLADPLPEPQSDFSGYGPKYQRSDERLREQVCDRLTSDPFVDATDIDVRVEHREVTLEGLVRTRDQRRRAEDVAASIRGVSDVMNRLRYE